jgi:hypothetical protein
MAWMPKILPSMPLDGDPQVFVDALVKVGFLDVMMMEDTLSMIGRITTATHRLSRSVG